MQNFITFVSTAMLNSIGLLTTQWADIEKRLKFLGIKIINAEDFFELTVRLLFNFAVIFFVVHFIYAKRSRRKDFYFSFLSVGMVVFLLSFLLNSVKLELGFALGLFAIFGIIRYRTDAIPIKEMTYLFVIIGISVINALANKKVSYAELLFTNMVIAGGLWLLEKRLMLRQERAMTLIYEKIENIHSMKKQELMSDLKERTGLEIKRYEINTIDFLKDTAEITLYFNINEDSEQTQQESKIRER